MNFVEFKSKYKKKEVLEKPNSVNPKPIVSICIQTYNQRNFISKCLDSILSQKISYPFEILIGEDNSQDGTREICEQYAAKHPDLIRLFLHNRENNIKINGRPTGIFNSLYNLYSARGQYIAYCDGDDFWNDELKLQKQIDFLLKNKNYVFTYHAAITIDETGKILYGKSESKNMDLTQDQMKKILYQPGISTWCFKNIIRDFPDSIAQTINGDNFFISLLGFYGSGKFLNNIKASYYRKHTAGIWSMIDRREQFISKQNTFANIARYYKENGEHSLYKHFIEMSRNYSKMLIILSAKRWQYINAIKYTYSLVFKV